MIYRKSNREIDVMREAGRMVGDAHQAVAEEVRPGVTTGYLESVVERFVRSRGGELIFKGYRGFPGSICTSVNEEIVHGIPGNRVLREGDVVSVDIGVRYQGYVGDSAKTYPVGGIDEESSRLLDVCRSSLDRAIGLVGPEVPLSRVSAAVQTFVEAAGFSVVREYAGHGVGREMHEDPRVPNYVDASTRREDVLLRPGVVVAIEPMVNIGTPDTRSVLVRGWEVVVTRDGKRSAHFEHTVAVTEDGYRILTLPSES